LLSAYIVKSESAGLRATYIVGKKFGGAVRRNRLRRLLREAFRGIFPTGLGGHKAVMLPMASAAGADLKAIEKDMERIFQNAGFIEDSLPARR